MEIRSKDAPHELTRRHQAGIASKEYGVWRQLKEMEKMRRHEGHSRILREDAQVTVTHRHTSQAGHTKWKAM